MTKRKFRCYECEHTREIAFGAPRPSVRPQGGSANLHQAEEDRDYARRGIRGRGGGVFGRSTEKGKV